jgi:hypothetical protein
MPNGNIFPTNYLQMLNEIESLGNGDDLFPGSIPKGCPALPQVANSGE